MSETLQTSYGLQAEVTERRSPNALSVGDRIRPHILDFDVTITQVHPRIFSAGWAAGRENRQGFVEWSQNER